MDYKVAIMETYGNVQLEWFSIECSKTGQSQQTKATQETNQNPK